MKSFFAKKINRAVKGCAAAIITLSIVIGLSCVHPVPVRADMATDTLEIFVGYLGMQTNEYVSVAKYHWSELLDRCALDSQAYSYFQRKLDGINYSAIVDSANGFYISDILDISKVYVGDIYNIMFYVRDAQGIWTAFDYYSLFRERYYYPNLASHRKVHYRTYEEITKKEVYETVTVTEMVDVTETVTVTEMVDVYETVEKTETVPVLDENGDPVLDEEGNPKTEEKITYEEVPVYNEDGSIKQEEIPVYNEDGSVKTMEVPVYNEDGTVKQEEVPVYNEDGSVKTEQIPVYNPDGTIKTEIVTETKTDYSTITGYTFEEAERFGVPVAPMLALEDNWKTFNQDFENIYEDFSNMSTGNRFRLLFGQTNPTESLARESANYVSALYITLSGMPVYGDITEGGEYGSNTVELDVSNVYNQDMTDQLSQYLDVDSTDESVIRIDKIETISNDLYSDVARVIVYYSVIGDGEASFEVGVGANGDKKNYSGQASIFVKDGKAEFRSGSVIPEEETAEEPETGNEETTQDTQGGIQDTDDKKISEEGITGEQAIEGAANGDSNVEKQINAGSGADLVPGNVLNTADSGAVLNGAYLLADDIGRVLAGTVNEVPKIKPQKDVTQVKLEDNTEEKKDLQKMILLLTGAGIVLMCILGGVFEIVSFRLRLGKRLVRAEE